MEYDLDALLERIEAAPYAPWVTERPQAPLVVDGVMNFSRGAGLNMGQSLATALTAEIHEGGDNDRNRWTESNHVTGYLISLARHGHLTLNEAIDKSYGYMLLNMKPRWPDDRFQQNFKELYRLDIKNHGKWPEEPKQVPVQPGTGLERWKLSNWAMDTPEPRCFLVPGLVQAGVVHTLAAEGGAGKTLMLLELNLLLAAAAGGMEGLGWLGTPINMEAVSGGSVIMFTAEDEQKELHIRLHEIYRDKAIREAAKDRFHLVPMINDGGVFRLLARAADGEPKRSARWEVMCGEMEAIAVKGKLLAVTIDTMSATLHGSANDGEIVTQYYGELRRQCAVVAATSFVSHHIRKSDPRYPIRSVDDMKAAVKGSIDVLNSSRVVYGLWPDRKQGRKGWFNFTILKGNNPELDPSDKVRSLQRAANGLLVEATRQIDNADESVRLERLSWLAHAIGQAALARHPYTASSLHRRRHELPDVLKNATRDEMADLIQSLLHGIEPHRVIVEGKLAGKSTTGYLDIPDGPVAQKSGDSAPGVFKPGWHRWKYVPETGEIRNS